MEYAVQPSVPQMTDAVAARVRDEAELAAIASGAWDGIERRTAFADVEEIRGRLVDRLHQRRFMARVLLHAGVFVLAMLAAFGACWIAGLVIQSAPIPSGVKTAMEVGGMFASGAAGVFGAIVSWNVGWRSFFVGWLAGGKLFLAAALVVF